MTSSERTLSTAEIAELDEREIAAATLAGSVIHAMQSALERSGLSQRELAAKLGVTEGAVSQVLNGDGNLRIYTLARYLRALGFEMDTTLRTADQQHLGGRRMRESAPPASEPQRKNLRDSVRVVKEAARFIGVRDSNVDFTDPSIWRVLAERSRDIDPVRLALTMAAVKEWGRPHGDQPEMSEPPGADEWSFAG